IEPHPDSRYATTGSISYSTGNAIDGRDDLDGLNSPWIGREVVDRHCAEKAKRRVTTISHLDGVGCNRIVAACCQPCKSVTAIEIGSCRGRSSPVETDRDAEIQRSTSGILDRPTDSNRSGRFSMVERQHRGSYPSCQNDKQDCSQVFDHSYPFQ